MTLRTYEHVLSVTVIRAADLQLTNAVDWHARSFPRLDSRRNARRLGVCRRVEIEITYVQLRIWVCCGCSLERNGDEALAKHVVEDIASKLAIFTKHLIDDVPCVDLAFVACHFGCDMGV